MLSCLVFGWLFLTHAFKYYQYTIDAHIFSLASSIFKPQIKLGLTDCWTPLPLCFKHLKLNVYKLSSFVITETFLLLLLPLYSPLNSSILGFFSSSLWSTHCPIHLWQTCLFFTIQCKFLHGNFWCIWLMRAESDSFPCVHFLWSYTILFWCINYTVCHMVLPLSNIRMKVYKIAYFFQDGHHLPVLIQPHWTFPVPFPIWPTL